MPHILPCLPCLPCPPCLLQSVNQAKLSFPKLFKGIALFTPGGDLIYCIDPTKQQRWHLQLCAGLQEILALSEPPHFLVPCYTATIDCWLNPRTQQVQIFAEAYPLVLRHQALLSAVFEMGDLVWQAAPWLEGLCDPLALATYRSVFPQLWEARDLIVRFEHPATRSQLGTKPTPAENTLLATELTHSSRSSASPLGRNFPLGVRPKPPLLSEPQQPEKLGYVLRLFVAGHSVHTERTLQTLHQLLEQSLRHPYTLTVVDVFKHPEQAEADQVSATPTLVKVWPPPMRRLVGNLDNSAKILQLLVSLDV